MDLWLDFERTAWNTHRQNGDDSVDIDDRSRDIWSRLSSNTRVRITSAIEEYDYAVDQYEFAEQKVIDNSGYAGSQDDNDAYGQEQNRPSFADYRQAVQGHFDVLREIERAVEDLQDAIDLLPPQDRSQEGSALLNARLNAIRGDIMRHRPRLNGLQEQGEAARKRLDERKRISFGLGPQWVGTWKLGSGSFGSAVLYVKQDHTGHIVDHLAVKETDFRTSGLPWVWDLKELWTGWKADTDSVPNEIQAMVSLRNKTGSENIVKLRNWRIAHRYHRIYMEYCPGGDLYDFACQSQYYLDAVRRRNTVNRDRNMAAEVRLIPEAFIWSAFLSMATAGLLMERGEVDQDAAKDDWETIVHRDLKISNAKRLLEADE